MPLAFVVGLGWGATGLAWAWVVAFPAVPLFAFLRSRGPLAINAAQLGAAIAPGVGAAVAMALPVYALSQELADWANWSRLLALASWIPTPRSVAPCPARALSGAWGTTSAGSAISARSGHDLFAQSLQVPYRRDAEGALVLPLEVGRVVVSHPPLRTWACPVFTTGELP